MAAARAVLCLLSCIGAVAQQVTEKSFFEQLVVANLEMEQVAAPFKSNYRVPQVENVKEPLATESKSAARTFLDIKDAPAPAAAKAKATPTTGAKPASTMGAKPKMQDGTLEGRYATALFMASGGKLDKVYADLSVIRGMMVDSQDFRLFIETPGVNPELKVAALGDVCAKTGADPAILNFLRVLVENRRIAKLAKIIDLFEAFYRDDKGLVPCKVTSATPLSSAQMADVKKAMEKRAEQGSQLIMEYATNPAIMGGLVVKMGEAIIDNSVATRLERIQTQLLQPMN